MAALLTEHSIQDAARKVDVSERTLRRWMQLPEFRDAFLQLRRENLQQVNARIQHNASSALTVQLTLMLDGLAVSPTKLGLGGTANSKPAAPPATESSDAGR